MNRSPSPAGDRLLRALALPLTILAWMAVVIIVLWLLGHITHALVMIALAAVLSFALAPLVRLLSRRLTRPLAVAGAYLIGIAIIIAVGSVLVVNAAEQIANLVGNLPGYARTVRDLLPRALVLLGPFGVTADRLQSLNQELLGELQRTGGTVAVGTFGLLRSAASKLIDASLVLILSVYFTLGAPQVGRWLREDTPSSIRHYVRDFLDVVQAVVGGYVRGTLTMALLIGVLVGVGLAVLGVPYAMLLGILAFFMEFIPIVGVLISGAVSLLVTLPRGLGTTAVVLVYFIIVHILEGDVIGPRIMGKAVGIHPATGIVALLIGSEVFGVWGALFAAPIAGLAQALLTGIWRARQLERHEEAAARVPVERQVNPVEP